MGKFPHFGIIEEARIGSMMLEDIAILAAETCRSRIYLQTLEEAGLLPSAAVLLDGASDKHLVKIPEQSKVFEEKGISYNLVTPVPQLLKKTGVPISFSRSDDPNSEETIDKIRMLKQETIIYSGPVGIILKDKVLGCGKKFLHIHPGRLPRYRGSTTIYYSLIKEGRAGASAFFMDRKIDNGPVIMQSDFPPFDNPEAIDYFYDSYMRAQLLKKVLREYARTGCFEVTEQVQSDEAENYYVIHPILKSIAIYQSKS
jgi:methionyl-tRNA formyltransferase